MSLVTNVVLVIKNVDDVDDGLAMMARLDQYLSLLGLPPLGEASDLAGGNKQMEMKVYLGAFNHFDAEAFGEKFKRAGFSQYACLSMYCDHKVWLYVCNPEKVEIQPSAG